MTRSALQLSICIVGLKNLTSEKLSEDKFFFELSGNTLSVYWYFLTRRRNPIGVREVQRALRFSSSSTADYHLKLMDLGLIDKDSFGNYKVKRVVKVGVINAFWFVGRFVFPKHLIYSMLTSAMILLFLLWFAEMLSLIVFVALLPGILATVVFWYETLTVGNASRRGQLFRKIRTTVRKCRLKCLMLT